MELEWLPHARERRRQRGISEALVRQTVNEPQQIAGRGAHKVFQSRYFDSRRRKEYLLRVFAEVHGDTVVILSVYRTSKLRKYWRIE